MDKKDRKYFQYALQTIFRENQVNILQNTEKRKVEKVLVFKLSENEVSAIDRQSRKTFNRYYIKLSATTSSIS